MKKTDNIENNKTKKIIINGYEIDDNRHYAKMNIAGLKVGVAFDKERMTNQTKDYIIPDSEWDLKDADFRINIPMKFLEDIQKDKYSHLTIDELEYLYTGSCFNQMLTKYDGCMLHSSAVVLDGVAYLFSANSGTGKSTHTQLWLKHFGDRAYIINDDKPAIRKIDGEWYVFGTPWSGKTDQNVNAKAKLGAIVFIERSPDNWIVDMDTTEAIVKFIPQTTRRIKEEKLEKLLDVLDKLLSEVPVYKMGCNISDDAVITAYNKIKVD